MQSRVRSVAREEAVEQDDEADSTDASSEDGASDDEKSLDEIIDAYTE